MNDYERRRKAADAAVAKVQRVIDDVSRSEGAPDLVGSFLIACHLQNGGRSVQLQRMLRSNEGGGEFDVDIEGGIVDEDLTVTAIEAITHAARTQVRAHRHERLMDRHGHAAWLHQVHPIMRSLILPGREDQFMTAMQDWIPNQKTYSQAMDECLIPLAWAEAHVSAWAASAGFIDVTITFEMSARRRMTMHLERHEGWLLIHEEYPETVVQNMLERPLGEVIPQEPFTQNGSILIRGVQTISSTMITIDGGEASMGEAPVGVDMSWMRLPSYQH